MTSSSNLSQSTEPGPNLIPFDRTRKQTLFSKYKSAIVSTLEVYNDFSDNHIFYCLDKLEREEKKVDATALSTECLDTDEALARYFERDDDSSDGITISELMAMESRRNEPAMARPASAATTATETSTVNQTLAAGSSTSTPNHTKTAKLRNQSSNGIPAGASSTNESFSLPTVSNVSVTSYIPTQAQSNDLDVVDGAYPGAGIFSNDEDQVDNIHAASFPSALDPSPSHYLLKAGASAFRFSATEPTTPEPNDGRGSEVGRAEMVKDCLQAVTRENQILETTRTCVLCKVNPRGVTFLPCGHFVSCRECAGPVYVCSLCGKNILATVETFLC